MSQIQAHHGRVRFPKLAAAAKTLANNPAAKVGLDILRELGSSAFARGEHRGDFSARLRASVPHPLLRLARLLGGAGTGIKNPSEFAQRLGEFFRGKRPLGSGKDVVLPTLKNRSKVAAELAEILKKQIGTTKSASTRLETLKKDLGLTTLQKELLSKVKDPAQRAQLEAQLKLYNAQHGSPVVLDARDIQLSPDQQALLNHVKDPAQRAMLAAQLKLSNATRAHEAHIAIAEIEAQQGFPDAKNTGLTVEQQNLLSKIKDPNERRLMKEQLEAFNAKFGSPVVSDPSARQLTAQEKELLSQVKDPSQRALLEAQFVLRHAVEAHKKASTQAPSAGAGSGTPINVTQPTTQAPAPSSSAPIGNTGSIIGSISGDAFNTGLTEDQKALLKKVSDPTQQAQMEAQFQMQNYQNLMQFISNIMRIMGDISKSIVANIR